MKTISCFSYKGGAGRSTLAMNIVPFLAKELGATPEHPLILVDMDIDSCGLTFLYNLQNEPETSNKYYVQFLFGETGVIPKTSGTGEVNALSSKLLLHLCPVGDLYNNVNDARSVLCLPAKPGACLGSFGSNYDAKAGKVGEFESECKRAGCCGILYDSAVGDQLTAIWSNQNAKTILCVMRPTKQFREGTDRYFDNYDTKMCRNKRIIVVPNVVPPEELIVKDGDEVKEYPQYAKNAIIKSFNDNQERENNDYVLDLLDGDSFGIPQIDRFMWQEDILDNVPASNRTAKEKIAIRQYERIAKLIGE